MSGAISLLIHTPSRRGQGTLYLSLPDDYHINFDSLLNTRPTNRQCTDINKNVIY
jgi:hypothetical protein